MPAEAGVRREMTDVPLPDLLEAPGFAATLPERRRAPRYPSRAMILCRLAGAAAGDDLRVQVRDVSDTGVGLVLDRPVARGALLVLEFPATGSNAAHVACARVAHCSELPEGGHLAGCQLQSELTPDVLDAMIRHDA